MVKAAPAPPHQTGRQLTATGRQETILVDGRTTRRTYAQAASSSGTGAAANKPPQIHNAKEEERRAGNTVRVGDANSMRVVVLGVRRVWGVLKYCPSGAVISTIQKLARQDFGEKLTVHRKFREGRGGHRDRWWFLLKGDEVVLLELEKLWDKVAFQTGWKIETCTMPNQSNNPSTINPSASDESQEVKDASPKTTLTHSEHDITLESSTPIVQGNGQADDPEHNSTIIDSEASPSTANTDSNNSPPFLVDRQSPPLAKP